MHEKPWSRSWKVLVSRSVKQRISQATHLPKGLTISTQETNESSRSFHERAIDNTGPVPARHALSQLYPANSTTSLCAPGHVYNFSYCSVTLNIAGNDAVQKSTSDTRRGYKRIFIEESDSEWSESVLNALTLFEKVATLYFQSQWKFVSRPGCQWPGIFVQK